MPDHHVRPGERLERRVDEFRDRPWPTALAASVRYVSDPSHSASRSASRPVAPHPVELARAASVHVELGEHRRQARSPRAGVALGAGEHADDRRELREPALLAPDAEHLHAVDARGVAPEEQLAHSCERVGGVLGIREPALEQRERGAEVLGDVEDERLPCVLGHALRDLELALRRGDLAERHQRADPPLHRLGLDLDVAELAR